MPVQRRERTLFEKLAHVHQVVVRYPEPDAERRLRQIGRHYYDIHALLGDEVTLQRLQEPGTADRLAQEANRLSEKAGFPYVPRPEGGFGASPAFDADHPTMGIVRESYQMILRLVFGIAPTLEECLGRVRELSDLLSPSSSVPEWQCRRSALSAQGDSTRARGLTVGRSCAMMGEPADAVAE
jgi:hypothetical protein